MNRNKHFISYSYLCTKSGRKKKKMGQVIQIKRKKLNMR